MESVRAASREQEIDAQRKAKCCSCTWLRRVFRRKRSRKKVANAQGVALSRIKIRPVELVEFAPRAAPAEYAPIAAFVNYRSGNRAGEEALLALSELPFVTQIFILGPGGPRLAFDREPDAGLPPAPPRDDPRARLLQAHDGEGSSSAVPVPPPAPGLDALRHVDGLRVVVCGGDGRARPRASSRAARRRRAHARPPAPRAQLACTIAPRELAGRRRAPLLQVRDVVRKARLASLSKNLVPLDRWLVESDSLAPAPANPVRRVFQNYFSIGFDAQARQPARVAPAPPAHPPGVQVTLDFHALRERQPGLMSTRFFNKLAYIHYGIRGILAPTPPPAPCGATAAGVDYEGDSEGDGGGAGSGAARPARPGRVRSQRCPTQLGSFLTLRRAPPPLRRPPPASRPNTTSPPPRSVDGRPVAVPPATGALVICNIPSYAAGLDLWTRRRPPSRPRRPRPALRLQLGVQRGGGPRRRRRPRPPPRPPSGAPPSPRPPALRRPLGAPAGPSAAPPPPPPPPPPPRRRLRPAEIGDGIFEVVALLGPVHLALAHMRLKHAIRLAQGTSISLAASFCGPAALQADGEAWVQRAPCSVRISHFGRARMVAPPGPGEAAAAER
eukprot:tig00020684_g12860.t1